MLEDKGALNEFLGNIPSDQQNEDDPFGEKPEAKGSEKEEKPEGTEKEGEEGEEGKEPKNERPLFKDRHHRRIEQKLQRERESNIALAERVKVLSEVKQFSKDAGVDERLVRLYGTEENGPEAAKLHAALLQDLKREAKEEAVKEFQSMQAQAVQAQREAEAFIDDELEALEEDHNVDLTSDAPAARKARRELLELVAKLSPKDEEGNVKDYADFGEAFEIYQTRKDKPDASKAKELANRSMTKSGASAPSKLQDDAAQSYLKSIGVL